MLYNHLENKLDEDIVHQIVGDAVTIEEEFCTEALPVNLIGMNATEMQQYVRFVADYLLVLLGYNKVYHAKCPYPYMDNHALESKKNFFEMRPVEYAAFQPGSIEFKVDVDF
jgi:ribonucleoside-diphosphate reductase beta chain